jgi:hypothetical protein
MAEQWAEQYGFKLRLHLYMEEGGACWRRNCQGSGRDIRPYADGRPEESRRYGCTAQGCVTLYQGKLYQCPPLAWLPLVMDKLTYKAEWEPYARYKGLDFAASDAELNAFVKGVHGIEFCGMCPKRIMYIDPTDGSPAQG